MIEEQNNPDRRLHRDRERLIADAVAAYHDLRLQEKAIDPDEYCRDYPEIAQELRAQLLALDEIETVLMPGETTRANRAPELPERLSGHKILGEIGAGGMGRVLLAFDERLGRKVAVKTLNPRYAGDSKLRERFMREARALARLDHPNIVRIYNLGDAGEEPHFVMEYIEGSSLTDAARRLTLTQKIDLTLKVVLTVAFLHQRRMIHRDLKPGNILVGPDLEPKVLDFGLAAQFDDVGERLTQAGEIMGTPDYFSPEQAQGATPLDARSDVFSLGAILYELITGSTPFRGENARDQIRSSGCSSLAPH